MHMPHAVVIVLAGLTVTMGSGAGQLLFLIALVVAVLLTKGEDRFVLRQKDPELEEDKELYEVYGEQTVAVPTCATDEYLTSNGTHLLCRQLPDAGFCDCPDLTPQPGSGDQPSAPVAPLPPPGCQVYSPPTRGAYACLRSPDTIYCSVLCDHRFEFSSTPKNPYYCGQETGFNWRDYPNGLIQQFPPQCTGFRHRLRLLHSYEHYLPTPCYGLSDHTIRVILEGLSISLEVLGCESCKVEDSFIQCPEVQPSARFYNQVADARYKRK